MSAIEELEAQFGIAGVVTVNAGQGGLPRVCVSGASAAGEIYLHGAQVTSWRPAGFEEVLFLSKQSAFAAGKAIRGGIPVCFPWFRNKEDDAKAPSHGVVRTKAWQLDAVEHAGGETTVSLSTASNADTLAWWPHDFALTLRVVFGQRLVQELVMRNTGPGPLRFEEALHTYYQVGAAESIRVSGLDGVSYLDNTDGNRQKQQQGEMVFTAQTDRAYGNTAHAVEILDPLLKRRIRLEKENSLSTVVWNPWSTGAKTLADLGDEEWRTMACVEAGNIRAFGVELAPGASHTMKTTAEVVTLPAA